MSEGTLFDRVRATGRLWNSVLVVFDVAVIVLATTVAYYARFEGQVPAEYAQFTVDLIIISCVVYIGIFAMTGLYRLVLRYVGVDTLLKLLGATFIGAVAIVAANVANADVNGLRPAPIGVVFIQGVLVFLGTSGTRLAARVVRYLQSTRVGFGHRVLIVGAGSAGSLLLREIQEHPVLELFVAGFLDDDRRLIGQTIGGVPVIGTTGELKDIAEQARIEEILVALPSAPPETVRRILNAAADIGIQTRIMPQLVIAKGSVSLRDLRSVDVEDLLGREPTPIDIEQVRNTIAERVVAVTGAAGSIGAELCRQIVRLGPAKLLLIEIDETRLYELWLELEGPAPGVSEMCMCDIRDARSLDKLFAERSPSVVLHAAAYKHVPLMELAPAEAIKTNIVGTRNVIAACERHDVERFVLISTDKAVAPANIMGLTKSLAEKIMLAATRRGELNAVAVRFGNVLASRGSVVPIFEEQLRRGGPLTVTHPEVTRYFMTIPEAARLVLQAQAIGASGDIFVLEMGEPVRIVDLARKMIALSGAPADIEFVGLRPGEKLHEELVNACEKLIPTGREKILRVDRVDVPSPQFEADIESLVSTAEKGQLDELPPAIERLEPGFYDRENAAC